MRDYLYLWHNRSGRYLVASGIKFRDFLPLLETSGGVVLLRHEAEEVLFDRETGLDYVEAGSIASFVDGGNVNTFGDLCWADFRPGGMPRMARQELAELLFFGNTHEGFKEVGLASLGNRFLAYAHDDGWYLKLLYTHWDNVAEMLGNMPLLAGRSGTMAALAAGDCAFWIEADKVEPEVCTHGIDELLNRRVWAHEPAPVVPPPQTLDEVAASLPNGFHDSCLRELTLDFSNREVRMILDILVGEPEAPDQAGRERVRRAELSLSEVGCWVSDRFCLDRPLKDSTGLCIDIGTCGPGRPPEVPSSLAAEPGPVYWLFCDPSNALTFFTAGSASLEWFD